MLPWTHTCCVEMPLGPYGIGKGFKLVCCFLVCVTVSSLRTALQCAYIALVQRAIPCAVHLSAFLSEACAIYCYLAVQYTFTCLCSRLLPVCAAMYCHLPVQCTVACLCDILLPACIKRCNLPT